MKKLLIYFPENKLRPVGGQAGYLFNLKKGLNDLISEEEKEFDIFFYNNGKRRLEDNVKVRKIVPKRILEIRRALNDAFFLNKCFETDMNLFDYDLIHFHWTEEMYLNRKFLEQYKGKVILTSHTPCVMYKEKIDKLKKSDYLLLKKWIDRLEEIDRYAFERADYIIFPCKEAEEPYYNTWPKYSQVKKENKYRYMPSGIVQCRAKKSREDIRRIYNIPSNAFVISYVGRHNFIKGYDDLKKMGEYLLKDNNIYFLIAGKEEPLRGLKHPHWIEAGWTDDPHSLIAASDVFILPNKETYFDLVLLEVISLGVPIVLSDTGGNKFFKQFNESGLMFYNSLDEAYKNLQNLKNKSKDEREEISVRIQKIFENNFTVEKFANNYINIIAEIIKDDYR